MVILAVDAVMVWFYDSWTPWPFSPVGGIVVGLAGLLVIITTVFMRFLLPAGIEVPTRRRRSRTYMFVFLGCVALAALVAVVFGWARDEYFDGLHIRFIGGLDSSIVIFLLG